VARYGLARRCAREVSHMTRPQAGTPTTVNVSVCVCVCVAGGGQVQKPLRLTSTTHESINQWRDGIGGRAGILSREKKYEH
jgi:hypothetical protein